jgi:hypothetical protein
MIISETITVSIPENQFRFSPDLQHVVPTFTIPDDRKFVENPVFISPVP